MEKTLKAGNNSIKFYVSGFIHKTPVLLIANGGKGAKTKEINHIKDGFFHEYP
jgi:hypothetical protein